MHASPGLGDHGRRPVDGGDAIPTFRKMLVVAPRAAPEVEDVRPGPDRRLEGTKRPLAHLTECGILIVRPVVGGRDAIEGALGVEKRLIYCSHGAALHPVLIEQTQRLHTGLAPTS